MDNKREWLIKQRIDAMRATMKDNMKDVFLTADRLCIPIDAVLCILILNADGFTNIANEVKYAVQCKVSGKQIYDALKQCIDEKTIQPLQMLYVEKGGGTE